MGFVTVRRDEEFPTASSRQSVKIPHVGIKM